MPNKIQVKQSLRVVVGCHLSHTFLHFFFSFTYFSSSTTIITTWRMSSTKFAAEIGSIRRRNLSNRSQNCRPVRFQELEATRCQSHLFPIPDARRTPGVPRTEQRKLLNAVPGQKQLESTVRGGGKRSCRLGTNWKRDPREGGPPLLTLLFHQTKGSPLDGEAR